MEKHDGRHPANWRALARSGREQWQPAATSGERRKHRDDGDGHFLGLLLQATHKPRASPVNTGTMAMAVFLVTASTTGLVRRLTVCHATCVLVLQMKS
jgi:hypothetical protein